VLTTINNVLSGPARHASRRYFIKFTSIILKFPALLFAFLDFPSPAALPEYLCVEVFSKSCFSHPVVVS